MRVPTHFSPEEFRCRCGCGLGIEQMRPELLERLEAARDKAAIPFRITSAIRCPAHNRAVGGVPTSAHLYGWAVDIACTTSGERYRMVSALIEAGFIRLGIARSFIHADCDPTKPARVIWLY